MRRTAAVALAAVLAATLSAGAAALSVVPAGADPIALPESETRTAVAASTVRPATSDETRDVMFVGNNWDGTATIVDGRTHRRIKTINTIPDKDERMAEILSSPDKLAFYLAIQQGVGEGHDQS